MLSIHQFLRSLDSLDRTVNAQLAEWLTNRLSILGRLKACKHKDGIWDFFWCKGPRLRAGDSPPCSANMKNK